jgi:hypothetical protein
MEVKSRRTEFLGETINARQGLINMLPEPVNMDQLLGCEIMRRGIELLNLNRNESQPLADIVCQLPRDAI